ncbi:hypothetical protein AURDEDRAFT_111749 [Auricularia subglabra TFB-10046 SS5]|nr:hypothetical protein AURDEDRAFT_111749 [Auricularia subglabra TFB-10046 SS5]
MRVLAAVLALSSLAAAALAPRNCKKMPSGPDSGVRDEIYRVALTMGVNDKVMLAMMSAAITETWVNNLDCGDKDSVGVFQQRPSQGWGSVAQLMDIDYSTRAFLKLCIALEKSHPGIDAGVLAQLVQRAEAGNQYTKNEGLARQYIAAAAKSVGGPAPAPDPEPEPTNAPAPPKTPTKPTQTKTPAQPKPTPTKTQRPTDAPPTPTLTPAGTYTLFKPDGAPMTAVALPSAAAARLDLPLALQVALGLPEDGAKKGKKAACKTRAAPLVGDSCGSFALREGLSLETLHALNPGLNQLCTNLEFDGEYCVKQA